MVQELAVNLWHKHGIKKNIRQDLWTQFCVVSDKGFDMDKVIQVNFEIVEQTKEIFFGQNTYGAIFSCSFRRKIIMLRLSSGCPVFSMAI